MPLPCYRVILRKATGQWKRNWAVRRCGPGSGCRFLIQPEKMEPSSITGDVQQRRERTTHLLASTRWEREDNVEQCWRKEKMTLVEEREKRYSFFEFEIPLLACYWKLFFLFEDCAGACVLRAGVSDVSSWRRMDESWNGSLVRLVQTFRPAVYCYPWSLWSPTVQSKFLFMILLFVENKIVIWPRYILLPFNHISSLISMLSL